MCITTSKVLSEQSDDTFRFISASLIDSYAYGFGRRTVTVVCTLGSRMSDKLWVKRYCDDDGSYYCYGKYHVAVIKSSRLSEIIDFGFIVVERSFTSLIHNDDNGLVLEAKR